MARNICARQARRLLLAILFIGLAHSATRSVTRTTMSSGPAMTQRRLDLIEHAMPIVPAHRYERMVQEAFADRGVVLRWYIARVDAPTSTAIAEVVIIPHEER